MIERSFSFGDNNALVGTLCLPDQADTEQQANAGIVLFNAGIVHRIGPHRINVRLARALAASGIPSIRFDLAGLGDSARPSGEVGFEEQAANDIRAAMTALGEATGLQRFGLFGFCSGAYHSYNTAMLDNRVTGIQLFDAYRYPTLMSKLIRLSLRLRQPGLLRAMVRVTHNFATELLAKLLMRRPEANATRASEVGFIVDNTSKADFAKGIRRLLERGVDVAMAFAGEGLERYNYPRQFDDTFRPFGIAGKVRTAFLPDIDHVATARSAQTQLIDSILPWATRVAGLARHTPAM